MTKCTLRFRQVGPLLLVRELTSDTHWKPIVVRMDVLCKCCGKSMARGAAAYRPLSEGNGVAREDRVCARCVARLIVIA